MRKPVSLESAPRAPFLTLSARFRPRLRLGHFAFATFPWGCLWLRRKNKKITKKTKVRRKNGIIKIPAENMEQHNWERNNGATELGRKKRRTKPGRNENGKQTSKMQKRRYDVVTTPWKRREDVVATLPRRFFCYTYLLSPTTSLPPKAAFLFGRPFCRVLRFLFLVVPTKFWPATRTSGRAFKGGDQF